MAVGVGSGDMADGLALGLGSLPEPVVYEIVSRLDVPSICAVAASCRFLKACAQQVVPHLQLIDLQDYCPDWHFLERWLSSNGDLLSLKLDCTYLDDSAIAFLAMPRLQELVLKNCDHFSANLFLEIGRHCLDLRSLSLELGWQEDRQEMLGFSSGLESLLQRCALLESLSLRFEGAFFDTESFASIPRLVSPSLKTLHMGYVTERDAKQLFRPIRDARIQGDYVERRGLGPIWGWHIQKLSLVLDRITDALMRPISQSLRALVELELRDEPAEEPLPTFDLTNWGVQQVGCCPLLRRLSIVRSHECFPATFKRVNDLGIFLMAENCLNLESITLGGFSRITDAGCREILHSCLKLQTFELLHTTQLTDLAFHDLSATPLALVSVSLASCNHISDYSVQHLAFCENLEVLNFRGCRSVGDAGLHAVSTLLKLRVLVLNGSDASDIGLDILGKGRAPLVSLSVRGCQRVTDKGILALFQGRLVDTLEILDVSSISALTDKVALGIARSGAKITELRIRDCPLICDTSVLALASMPFQERGCGTTLKVLDLWNCRGITRASLPWFRRPYFPRLRWLGLGKNLSQEVLANLGQERPSLRICLYGTELDHYATGEGEDPPHYRSRYEEEDELEKWLKER